MAFRTLLAVALLCSLALPAGAQEVSGQVRVIDGDSLRMGATKIRLQGIDAPERDQVCHRDAPLRPHDCGLAAKDALTALIAGRPIDCEIEPAPDRYGRDLGTCYVAGVNINAWMVENGHAIAFRRYSAAYIPQEDRARAAGIGVWAGPFIEPWSWRALQKATKR